MALNSYATINTALLEWLNREGFTSISDRSEDFILLAQRRMNRALRLPAMEIILSSAVSTNTFAVPADYIETKDMTIIGDRNTPIARTDFSTVRQMTTPDRPRYFARAAGDFYLGPPPESEYDIELVYYAKLPAISTTNSTNWFSTNAPELILFAALVEAANFMKDEQRAQAWEGKYQQAARLLEQEQERSEFSGSDLSVRESNLIRSGFTP